MGELNFRRRAAGEAPGAPLAMLLLFVVTAAALFARPLWQPAAPDGVLIEVTGEVPNPGMHSLVDPTLASAVRAAGGDASSLADTPLQPGAHVIVGPDTVQIAPASEPLLVALPVDINTADSVQLTAVPGIGPSTAKAILAHRDAHGTFYDVDDLLDVRGIGEFRLHEVASFVTVGEVGERPPPVLLDLNTATSSQLESLPGIGPVTAARIVVSREEHGAFESIDALTRVKGIGPKTVQRIRDRVTVNR